MPTYRIGIGSEFNLKDRKVGIGSESPIGDLDITGIIQSGDLYSSGISTLTTYSGFSASNKDTDSITIGYNDRQIYTMSVTNNGTDHYTFSNATDRKGVVTGGDPDITINVGDTLKITNTVGATHPLWINHTQGTGNGNGVSDVIGNGDARNSAVVTWIPTESGVYYYNCQHHANMTGRITVQAVSFDRNYSTELDIVVGVGETFTVLSGTTLNVGSISDVKVENTFGFPVGDRPEAPVEGTVRFNEDLNTLEFYNGVEWRQFTVSGTSGRVVFAGGEMASRSPVSTSPTMHHLNINTFGNSIYFGEMVAQRRQTSCCGNGVRSQIWGGQGASSNLNEIDYFTIASEGNAVDFGNMLGQSQTTQALSSSTRGISYGHGEPASNVIQYTEIMTKGDAQDFADCYISTRAGATWASPTRGMLAGGAPRRSTIEYITIASKGTNGSYFGDLAEARRSLSGCSNSVRGLAMGGYDGSGSPHARFKTIDYVTIASTGNAIYFGDLTTTKASNACAASPIRGISAGGSTPTAVNTIDYVLIASSGSAMDFGDLSDSSWNQSEAVTDCHGGLGGY